MPKEERWLRIIPVALIMYTISYIDRTNIALALDPSISSMMKDLGMDSAMKGNAAGIFFIGYMLLQIPAGYLASHWSPKKLVSIFLVLWGIAAVGCGLVATYKQFVVMRFFLGVAESGVYPATLVLLANWFPRQERARANAYWTLCMPLAVAGSAPITSWLLLHSGDFLTWWSAKPWQKMLILEGALPFIWLPIWWFYISDEPKGARWISPEEKSYLETTLKEQRAHTETGVHVPFLKAIMHPAVFLLMIVYFLQNCAAYGCNTFFSETLDSGPGGAKSSYKGILFAIPYLVTAVIMIINSRHSDKTQERRGHVAIVYVMSGLALILSVWTKTTSFWLSFMFICFAIPGPFASLAPFWAIPSETMPRAVLGAVMGLVNAVGNVGGYVGPYAVGALKKQYGGVGIPFTFIGLGLLVAAALAMCLPKARKLPIPEESSAIKA